tara:strand:- start:3540 stop:5093 length:1554 start_codon:yes stop_codon:yes gene_type:complete
MNTVWAVKNQVRDLPSHHQVLFWLSLFMLVWQGIYLTRFFGDAFYAVAENPVYPPNECEITPSSGLNAKGMRPGEVSFHVDMRCVDAGRGTRARFDTVYVTTPLCGYCGPHVDGWNVLSDSDGDGIYSGSIVFKDLAGQSLVGSGIQYRYGIGWGDSDARGQYAPENLLSEINGPSGDSCAPTSDGLTYANRVVITDGDGTEVRSVFGTCVSVPIPDAEWNVMRQEAWEKANPFLSSHVDPWWGPISASLAHMELINPILFLTLCTALYVYAIFTIGTGYVYRKEKALTAALDEAKHKNTYLEHAAKILRHDMHSGINTYIPRGVRSLERRLDKADPEVIESLRLEFPLRLLKEGLAHTQKVYAGVTEFTNLVKAGAKIVRRDHDLQEILTDYLDTTSYKSEVVISELPTVSVNAPLFCTAIDNLIRNGLKYNDSPSKMVILTMVDEHHFGVIDNGRGLSQEDFIEYSKPYTRKTGQKENGTGLGLNICIAILHEHGFTVTASKRDEGGTLIKVKIT